MRIALLSTLDQAAGLRPGAPNPAFAQFAGASVVERQLDLALALGCATIACLTDSIGREVLALQHRAEKAEAKFVTMREPRALSGLVSAGDELLLLAPAVLPDAAAVMRHVARPAVLVFPAEPAVGLGYERINAEVAWTGVLLAPGSIVERLGDLPPDIDVPSALLRIALQSGSRSVPLEKRLLDEGEWHLRGTSEELTEREARFIHSHAAPAPFTAPGLAVAERLGARLAQDLLGKGGARVPMLVAGVAGFAALALGFAGLPGLGVGTAVLMTVFAAMGQVIERIGQAGELHPHRSLLSRAIDALTDPVLIALIALASPAEDGWLRVFVPLMLFGMVQLGARYGSRRWRMSYRDRIVLTLLLLPAAILGLVQPVAAALALAAMMALFFDLGRARD